MNEIASSSTFTSTPPAAQPAPLAPAPCPFCGGKPLIWKHLETDQWAVSCQDCEGRNGDPSTLNGFTYEADAIAAWNRRAPDPSRAALVAALRAAEEDGRRLDCPELHRMEYYHGAWHVELRGGKNGEGKTLRDAIDAARQVLAVANTETQKQKGE